MLRGADFLPARARHNDLLQRQSRDRTFPQHCHQTRAVDAVPPLVVGGALLGLPNYS